MILYLSHSLVIECTVIYFSLSRPFPWFYLAFAELSIILSKMSRARLIWPFCTNFDADQQKKRKKLKC